ncbi:MAG: hypothetical protein HY606_11120 [Planctomycetes bacterium]|nr:hypothetical protein [Planctomycetota bacterium]
MMKKLIPLVLVFFAVSFQDDNEVRSLLDEGIELYHRGKFKEAYLKFEEAIQKQPSHELVAAWIERVEQAVIIGMQNVKTGDEALDRNVSDLGRRLMELSKPSVTFPKMAEKQITYYLNNLASSDTDIWLSASRHLYSFGPYSVKYLVPKLGSTTEQTLRGRSMKILADIGQNATFGLCQALKSGNTFLKQNACIVLGSIKDRRSVGYLKRLLEDQAESQEVKSSAKDALSLVFSKNYDVSKINASSMLYEYAEGYFFGDPDVMKTWEKYYLVWTWDKQNEKLLEREVPPFAYNEQMAEEVLFDLINWYPHYTNAYPLFILTHLSQKVEADEILERGRIGVQADYMPPGIQKEIEKKLTNIKFAPVVAAIPQKKYIYGALELATREKNSLLAVACIEILKDIASQDDFPLDEAEKKTKIGTPLIMALERANTPIIRYHAAMALSKLVPHKKVFSGDKIIPALSEAITETGIRIILVIFETKTGEDFDRLNKLKNEILQANAIPIVANSLEEGLFKSKDHTIDDLIFIQYKLAGRAYIASPTTTDSTTYVSVFDSLRDDIRTKFVPKVILYSNEDEKNSSSVYRDHVSGLLPDTTEKFDIQKLIADVFSNKNIVDDHKRKADIVARKAAEALASLEINTTVLIFRDTIQQINSVLGSTAMRPNEIRIPLVRALGRFVDNQASNSFEESVANLLTILREKPSTSEVESSLVKLRIEAAYALANIFRKTNPLLKTTQLDEIVGLLSDDVIEIQQYIAEALSNCQLTNDQQAAILNQKRMIREQTN